MSNYNTRNSLDIYYPDNTNNVFNIKDSNDECDGLCTYDNVGLIRPTYTQSPNTDDSNLWNKYIWIEARNNALLFITVDGTTISGYLKFNQDQTYPIQGNTINNKKASIIIKYPTVGIMDQGTAKIKKIKDKYLKQFYKYKLILQLSKFSEMTFYSNDEKKKNNIPTVSSTPSASSTPKVSDNKYRENF